MLENDQQLLNLKSSRLFGTVLQSSVGKWLKIDRKCRKCLFFADS